MERRAFVKSLLLATGTTINVDALARVWQQAEQLTANQDSSAVPSFLLKVQQLLVPVPSRFNQYNILLMPFVSLMIKQALAQEKQQQFYRGLKQLERCAGQLNTTELKSQIANYLNLDEPSDVDGRYMLMTLRKFALIGLFSHPKIAPHLPSSMGYKPC